MNALAWMVKAISALFSARETEYERFCRERREQRARRRRCLNEAAHKLNN